MSNCVESHQHIRFQHDPTAHLKALVCGLPTPLRQRRLLAMLVAYVDDSGSEPNGHVFMLAGFIAPAENWVRFSDEWDKLSQEHPLTPDFKMAKAERLNASYWGQGSKAELEARRDEKVLAFAKLIRKYASYRISAGMDWETYKQFAQGKVPPHIDSPYFFLYWELIATVAQAWELEEKIEFVFDEQGTIGEIARSWYSTAIATLPQQAGDRITGTPSFKRDSDVLPLKAADMLAWQMRRFVRDKPTGAALRSPLALLLTLPHIHANIPRDKLRHIVQEIQRRP